jgi:hypothetical protein
MAKRNNGSCQGYSASGPTPDDLRAKVFEDRVTPGDWRVEKMAEDGGYEVV